jgi:DNA processing protein
LGTGIDIPYPNSHKRLYELIAQQGCVISEFALGTPGVRYNFPKRNRIIAGLSQALLVVEAARNSGSLITAKLAADFGREVMAIPGSIHSATSKGCHQLIRDGAALIESVADIFAACPSLLATQPSSETNLPLNESSPINTKPPSVLPNEHIHKIGFAPVSVQTLLEQSNESLAVWCQRLSEWEISGQITRLPDGRFVRTVAS